MSIVVESDDAVFISSLARLVDDGIVTLLQIGLVSTSRPISSLSGLLVATLKLTTPIETVNTGPSRISN